MKEHRKARILAETYVFGNKKTLTFEDKEVIQNSPFSNVLDTKGESKFLEIAETYLKKIAKNSIIKENTIENKNEKIQNNHKYFTGVSRDEIIELIRCIEDEFELDVPYDYTKLKAENLKEFIKKYSERHIFDDETKNLVLKIAEKTHPEEIMGGLRVYIGR